MRRIANAVAMLVLLGSLNACRNKTLSPEELLAEANALDAKIADAVKRKDVNTLMSAQWNSPSLVSLDTNRFLLGYEAQKAATAEWFKKGTTFEAYDVHNVVSGDVVVGWQRWKDTEAEEDGIPGEVIEGLQTSVKAMRDGKMVVIAQAFSQLPERKPSQIEMVAAADKLDRQLFDALAKRDWAAFVDVYWNSPELVIIDVDQKFQGANAWKEFLQEIVKSDAGFKVELNESHNTVLDETVLTWSKYTITLTAKKAVHGIRSSIKTRVENKWVVISDNFVHLKESAK